MENEINIFKNQLLEIIKEAKKNQKLSDTGLELLQDTNMLENLIRLLYPMGYTLRVVPSNKNKEAVEQK